MKLWCVSQGRLSRDQASQRGLKWVKAEGNHKRVILISWFIHSWSICFPTALIPSIFHISKPFLFVSPSSPPPLSRKSPISAWSLSKLCLIHLHIEWLLSRRRFAVSQLPIPITKVKARAKAKAKLNHLPDWTSIQCQFFEVYKLLSTLIRDSFHFSYFHFTSPNTLSWFITVTQYFRSKSSHSQILRLSGRFSDISSKHIVFFTFLNFNEVSLPSTYMSA
jgi:hypothetical protein